MSRRTKEIGIRMALGGQPGNVRNMILREGLALTAAGWLLGLAAAEPLAGYLESVLFGVNALDLLTLGASGAVMFLAATLACWAPARRATRVDPMLALRHE